MRTERRRKSFRPALRRLPESTFEFYMINMLVTCQDSGVLDHYKVWAMLKYSGKLKRVERQNKDGRLRECNPSLFRRARGALYIT